eukprot:g7950.t1
MLEDSRKGFTISLQEYVKFCPGRKRKDDGHDGSLSITKRQAKEGVVGSGRTVAQNIDYSEHRLAPAIQEDTISETRFTECHTESDALKETGEATSNRRLYEVEVFDEFDQMQPIELGKLLFIRGVIQPIEGRTSKKTGRRVYRFGPLIKWGILYNKRAIIQIQTEEGSYHCMSPSGKYKFLFQNLQEKARICHGVFEVLKIDISFSFETVLQHLQRSKVKHDYCTWRDALHSNATFILDELEQMTMQFSQRDATRFEESAFAVTLREECCIGMLMQSHSGITIGLENAPDRTLSSDEQLARQLQAKEEAKQLHSHKDKGSTRWYDLVHEEDIANDYPPPMAYEKLEDEIDEFLMTDEEIFLLTPEDLPQRTLTDFAFYNSEGLFSTLELLPSWSGGTPQVELYGSGIVGEESTELELQTMLGPSSSDAGGGGSSSGPSCETPTIDNVCSMRIYLSQIQEYVVECLMEKVFIWIRTEACWYKLDLAAMEYNPWFKVFTKCASIAIKIITLLLKEARVSKISFGYVVGVLSKEERLDSPTFISMDANEVKRFLVSHGQMLLNQFLNYPDSRIQNCSFFLQLKQLRDTMNNCRSQLAPKKESRKPKKSTINKNPMKDRVSSIKVKALPASATTLVQKIWKNYFTVNCTVKDEELVTQMEEEGVIEDLDFIENETNLGTQQTQEDITKPFSMLSIPDDYIDQKGVVLCGECSQDSKIYKVFAELKALNGARVKSGDIVSYHKGDLATQGDLKRHLGLIQCFLKKKRTEEVYAQLRHIIKGEDTVLGDAASKNEFFLEDEWSIEEVYKLSMPIQGFVIKGVSSKEYRENEDCIIKLIYKPKKGMFETLRVLHLGYFQTNQVKSLLTSFVKLICIKEDKSGEIKITSDGKLRKDGIDYSIGDSICFLSSGLSPDNKTAHTVKRSHKGSIQGMKPYGVGKITQIGHLKAKEGDFQVTLEVYYRPGEISEDLEEKADFWEIYQSDNLIQIKASSIVQKCKIHQSRSSHDTDTFICTNRVHTDSTGHKIITPLSSEATCEAKHENQSFMGTKLRTLDVFAGCGGLSEGLHQSGVVQTEWAIEYDDSAAEAFKQNHPETTVFCCNVSALLWRVMSVHGKEQDCISVDEVQRQGLEIPDTQIAQMPRPDEVDFIVGGPPCQGFSGMNRFNKSQWSTTQNSMVMNFLSFADYYRPKYFLLENVRNFVSHNSSRTFRLTLRTLIEMGFQVRFGVLNAGNYGVPQSRKRTFIWAAKETEILPEWPKALHVFHSPQLTINLPGGTKYAVHEDTRGALLRTVTVQDAISDLPEITNGSNKVEQNYKQEAKSNFQRKIRGNCAILTSHISKKLNEINFERCCCIPKNTPGADWRVLLDIVERDPTRAVYKGQPLVPWCLPNTAARHNNWRGLFGRLDRKGHFPTSTTDPQPMGKVGQVFHPDQDRIVSVRECARSQGFPDIYIFHGTIHQKHKQVGNAVPPPLAFALGLVLKQAIEQKSNE